MFNVEIHITLKKTVVDPQGLVIKHALESLGFGDIVQARCGKIITLKLDTKAKGKGRAGVEEMCKKLLANPIIEDYRITIKKA